MVSYDAKQNVFACNIMSKYMTTVLIVDRSVGSPVQKHVIYHVNDMLVNIATRCR